MLKETEIIIDFFVTFLSQVTFQLGQGGGSLPGYAFGCMWCTFAAAPIPNANIFILLQ